MSISPNFPVKTTTQPTTPSLFEPLPSVAIPPALSDESSFSRNVEPNNILEPIANALGEKSTTSNTLSIPSEKFGAITYEELQRFWNEEGASLGTTSQGARVTQLPNGLVRFDYPSGTSVLLGCKDGRGVPIEYRKSVNSQGEVWQQDWMYDIAAKGESIKRNASVGLQKSADPIYYEEATIKGVHVRITQWTPGDYGSQLSTLQFEDGRQFDVYSESPITPQSIDHIAYPIIDGPKGTYDYLTAGKGKAICIFDRIGEATNNGKLGEIDGVECSSTHGIVISRRDFEGNQARFTIPHEAAHRFAAEPAPHMRLDDKPPFGVGKLVTNDEGEVDMSQSDFPSIRASEAPIEDWAENFVKASFMRTRYNQEVLPLTKHKTDFFALDRPTRDAYLSEQNISPGIREKMHRVIEHHQAVHGEHGAHPHSEQDPLPGHDPHSTTVAPPKPVGATKGATVPPTGTEGVNPPPESPPKLANVAAEAPKGGAKSLPLGRVGHAVSKGMGALGVLGGAVQSYGGVQAFRRGKKLDGVVDTVGGVGNMIGGGSMLAGGSAAGTLGPISFGGAAMLDGGRDIIHGMHQKNKEKMATGGVKAFGGALMTVGGVMSATGLGSAFGGPIALIGGTLYLSGTVYENRKAIGAFATRSVNNLGEFVKKKSHQAEIKIIKGAVSIAVSTASTIEKIKQNLFSLWDHFSKAL